MYSWCVVAIGLYGVTITVQYLYGWCGKRVECKGVRRRLEIEGVNGERVDINQLLFADDTALVVNSVQKL